MIFFSQNKKIILVLNTSLLLFLFSFPDNCQLSNLTPLSSVSYYQNLKQHTGEKYWKDDNRLILLNQTPFLLKIPVKWSSDPYSHRSWQWMLNNFWWMDKLIATYKSNNNDDASMIKAKEYFLDWIKFSIDEDHEYEFRWKDDAVSFRAQRLAVVTSWALQTDKSTKYEKQQLLGAAQRHFDELRDPKKFEENNHGLFQMQGLMTLAVLLPMLEGADTTHEYAIDRVNFLWADQYGSENMHLENSPAYHLMINFFDNFLHSSEFNRQELEYNQHDIEEVRENYKYLHHPNGRIALMGDSHLSYSSYAKVHGDYVFKESGYVVLAGDQENANNSYLIMRTAFPSNIHRHSDDFSFEWSENGEVILTDAGRFSYDYDHPFRIYTTSTRAHNTIAIDDSQYPWWGEYKKYDYYPSAVRKMKIENGVSVVTAARYFDKFDTNFKRTLRYNKGKSLTIQDDLMSGKEHEYIQWFHFSPQFEVTQIDKDHYLGKSTKNKVIITAPEGATPILVKGQKEPYYQGWISLAEREVEPNYALGFKIL